VRLAVETIAAQENHLTTAKPRNEKRRHAFGDDLVGEGEFCILEA